MRKVWGLMTSAFSYSHCVNISLFSLNSGELRKEQISPMNISFGLTYQSTTSLNSACVLDNSEAHIKFQSTKCNTENLSQTCSASDEASSSMENSLQRRKALLSWGTIHPRFRISLSIIINGVAQNTVMVKHAIVIS